MGKKVLVIATSLRVHSNSDVLAKECVKGAMEAGHDVEFISLKGKNIQYCLGCLHCLDCGYCVLKDDVEYILKKVREAEVIVFASPLYYYGMSGQMKTLLDRLNPLYGSFYAFKDIYMIVTAADNSVDAFDKVYTSLEGWVDCFEGVSIKGMLKAGNHDDAGDVLHHPEVMHEAFLLGKGL